jgi:hypothetical protein
MTDWKISTARSIHGVSNVEYITVTWSHKTPGTAQAQEEEIVLKKLILLWFLALAIVGVPLAGLAQATFRQYAYVADSGGVSVASITSRAITLGAGDLVIVSCRTGNGSASNIMVSSSPSNTFKQLTAQIGGPGSQQVSYAMNARPGSTTFTCTPNLSSPYQSMVVLDYGMPPNSGALDQQGGSTTPPGLTYTSPSLSTSSAGPELIVLCGTVGSAEYAFTGGAIGSWRTTLRGVSGASPKAHADQGCEDAIAGSKQKSITGRITYGSKQPWAATVGTFVLEWQPRSSPKAH